MHTITTNPDVNISYSLELNILMVALIELSNILAEENGTDFILWDVNQYVLTSTHFLSFF
jgi:hypothetical protein